MYLLSQPLPTLRACAICERADAAMVRDEHGYSVFHECINMSTRAAVNYPTPEIAAEKWSEMQR